MAETASFVIFPKSLCKSINTMELIFQALLPKQSILKPTFLND